MKNTRLVLVLVLFVLIFSFVPQEAIAQNSVQVCGPSAEVSTLLTKITTVSVDKLIRDFSGANQVMIDGVYRTIKTRYSTQLFSTNPDAKAYDYLHQELLKLGYVEGSSLTDHVYTTTYHQTGVMEAKDLRQNPDGTYEMITNTIDQDEFFFQSNQPEQLATWKNKVVTIPGHGPNADKFVLMTAHMDSTSTSYNTLAPGAEDNASGIAALMEAARLLRNYEFDYTIKLIFFTGEEQGLWGSEEYVADHSAEMSKIRGVVNLDMFGYDSDQDMCIEMHVGTMAKSNTVGTCFTEVNTLYNLGLTYDYLTTRAIRASDHASFWDAGVGAIEILENYQYDPDTYGCEARTDMNPHYHKVTDTIDKMYMPATVATVKAGVGTVASLAEPMGKCFGGDPVVKATVKEESILLTWPELPGADVYNVYRSTATCLGTMTRVAQVTTNSFEDTNIQFDRNYFYKVEAAETDGVCFSQLSSCVVAKVPTPPEPVVLIDLYMPLIQN
ncbi:MAG: M20/M25/M40 family metallo-hydrolase [Anaerolineaceae bacterium]|nr:M20/M25/M40 family metallo-hydrolase [Anaerolineaceae bacterium]MDD4042082.1 M20/M25/M40 family metallo-hydrolase [Anaerolineaceae bacterium]